MRDLDIRLKLKDSVLRKYYFDNESRVVDEFCVCNGESRVDLAVINGSLHGYEIKSEADNLNRLPQQIEHYSKTFDYVTLISGESHLKNALELIPDWWGVIAASYKKNEGIKLKIVRPAKKNRKIEKLSVAQLLWKDEAIAVLKEAGLTKGLSGKSRHYLWNLLANHIEMKDLSFYVRSQLKRRPNWKSD